MDKDTALALGGIFFAISNALSGEQAQIARDALARYSQNPDIKSAEAKRAWALLAHSGGLTPEQAEAENAELDAMLSPRPRLSVITGGAA